MKITSTWMELHDINAPTLQNNNNNNNNNNKINRQHKAQRNIQVGGTE